MEVGAIEAIIFILPLLMHDSQYSKSTVHGQGFIYMGGGGGGGGAFVRVHDDIIVMSSCALDARHLMP